MVSAKRLERWQRDLEAIIHSSDNAVAAIEDRVSQMPSRETPLFVMLGEAHAVSAHALAQMRIMQILQNRGYKIAGAIELAHNEHRIWKRDLEAPRKAVILEEAPLTGRTVLRFFARRNISLVFSDAANICKKRYALLDVADSKTRRMVKDVESRKVAKLKIDVLSTAGIQVRNHFMISQMKQHAEKQKPDIYFQICGATHVAGMKKIYPYSESIVSIMRREDLPVLGIVFTQKDFKKTASPHIAADTALFTDSFYASQMKLERAWLDFAVPRLFPEQNYHLNTCQAAKISIKK